MEFTTSIEQTMQQQKLELIETDGKPLQEVEEAAKLLSPVKEFLPLKFKFQDEDEHSEKKSEFDLMVDDLFDYLANRLLESSQAEIEIKNDIPEDICKHEEQYLDEQIGM